MEDLEVIHVLEHESKAQVQCNINNVLDSGRCILNENAYNTTDFELTPESLCNEYGVPPLMEVDFHGECGHHLHRFRQCLLPCPPRPQTAQKDFAQPHIWLPICQFWESLDDPETVRYVLSLQLQQNAWFAPLR